MIKRISLILTLVFLFSLESKAQYLALDQLITLCDTDFNDISDYLAPKGFIFKDSKPEIDGQEATVKWRFKKGGATLILHNPGPNQYFTYWVTSKSYYDLYKSKIKGYNMELISSRIDKELISAIYEGANFVVSTSIQSDEGAPNYLMTVGRKEYLLRKLNALENGGPN